ncbi:MAG: hypothetical protein GXN91_00075 [Epsilonproteobacteria bacterium]|nr:hypothetical protein [Campylobacterota bacterium]
MVLKIIFLIIIIYLLYRFFGGKIEVPKFKKKENISEVDEVKELEENTLVECNKCGVYITQKEAIFKNKEYYCSDCIKEK